MTYTIELPGGASFEGDNAATVLNMALTYQDEMNMPDTTEHRPVEDVVKDVAETVVSDKKRRSKRNSGL